MLVDDSTKVRCTIEFDVTVQHRGELIELARRKVEEVYQREDWIDYYPENWQEALEFLLREGGISALPTDGPIDLHASCGSTIEVGDTSR